MPANEELIGAIGRRDVEKVRALLGADPALAAARPPAGPSPLLMAAYVRADAVVALLKPHVAMDACEAAALGDGAALRGLLARDAGAANARSGDGWTPLHLAGFFGHREIAELLLKHGASLSALSGGQEKNTPLHAALAGACDAATVRALLAHGADVNAAGANDYRPLHVAASRGNDELVRLLVEKGADLKARMTDGKSAADIAAERNHPATAALLRSLGG